MKECNELVSIFVKSVETNKKKMDDKTKSILFNIIDTYIWDSKTRKVHAL